MASFLLLCSVILLLLTSSNSSSSNDEENDSYNCVTPKKECGNCIALPECDSLSKILTETPSNPKSIRYLQKSTCGFSDDKVPLVCCPIPFSSNSKKNDICSDILPNSDTSNAPDTTTITTTPVPITTTIETTTPTTTTTTTTNPPTTQSSTNTPTTTSPTTQSSTIPPTTTEFITTTPTTTSPESSTTVPTTTTTTTTTPTPNTTTDYTPSSITTEKQSTDTLLNSSLITTEKPPEHLGGSNNQTESPSQTLAEKIISHPNLHLLPNSSDCGVSAVVDKIVGGQDAGLGKYPWMVLLGFSDELGRTQYACGGTLISSKYVLTASHCVAKLPAGFRVTTVRVGEYDQATDPDCFNGICAPKVQNIDIEQVIHHEDYDKTNHKENDIALIRLKTAAELSEFVLPVCLSHGEVIKKPKKISFVVSGFGRVAFDSPANAKILQEVTVPLVPTQICNNFYESKEQVGHIDDSRFCAGGQNGKDSCKGDSGGPLMTAVIMANTHSQRFFQYGIVSIGPSHCGVAAQPALYTRVQHYMIWILDHIQS